MNHLPGQARHHGDGCSEKPVSEEGKNAFRKGDPMEVYGFMMLSGCRARSGNNFDLGTVWGVIDGGPGQKETPSRHAGIVQKEGEPEVRLWGR